jgi:molecular chaperone HtpG
VIERLSARFAKDPADPRIAESARLLFGQAVLAEGGQLEDPSGFAELVNQLMAQTL